MAKRVGIFYAYPSNPPDIEEAIKDAIAYLKTVPLIKDANLHFRPWPDMSITGKRILREITQNIDRAEVFACDLTYPNLNVAFELGYAIARSKRVWISLNATGETAARDYQRVYGGILPSTGYAEYLNHRELSERFIADNAWVSLKDQLLGESYRTRVPRAERPEILYVRPLIETDAVIAALETLQSSLFADGVIIDDPNENPSPSLEWYAEKARRVDAALVHLLAPHHRDATRHNVKASFVAGLAHGFQKPLLMLAHSPFKSPVDYQHLFAQHDTADLCRTIVANWIEQLEPGLPRRRPRRDDQAQGRLMTMDLRAISVGEPVAENESDMLEEYFIETSSYYDALASQTAIMIGRKGTGKTAILFALDTNLGADRRNEVCVIKPPGYEIDGLVGLLRENLHLSERGYLIESLWKFLIYSELACSVADGISRRPLHQLPTSRETEFMDYVSKRTEVLCTPFSQRVDSALAALVGVGQLSQQRQQRARISEALHENELHDLRRLLGFVLAGRHKVAVLMDNLDVPWTPGHHIEYQTDLLVGLLRVATDVTNAFRLEKDLRRRVPMSLIIFLRSDIFAHIHPLTAEQDKLPLHRIVWNDEETLLRVVDQRLAHTSPTRFSVSDVWQKLLPNEVAGIPTRQFVISNTLARPRDVIYLVKQAIAGAINRGHSVVTDGDFLDARRNYSEFAFRSLLAEDDPNKGKLEGVLYEFAGAPKIMAETEVQESIRRAGVDEEDIDFYLDLLCDVNFLGVETVDGYRFPVDEGDRQMLRAVATTVSRKRASGQCSYQINAAFHQVLQIG